MTNYTKLFGLRLRQIMDADGVSKRDIAKRADLAERTVGYILSGDTSLKMDTAEKIAAALGVELWIMLLPDLDPSLAKSPALSSLVSHYQSAPPQTRQFIDFVAEHPAAYPAQK